MITNRLHMYLFLATLLLPISAHAYIDPVNGAMLLQLLLGGAAGILIFFRKVLKLLIKKLFRFKSRELEK